VLTSVLYRYAVLAVGGHQLMAFRSDYVETTLFGSRGHIPQMVTVALVGGDGRPLGVSNCVVYWETLMPDPPRPGWGSPVAWDAFV
jgi:hypothetical protein